MAPVDFADAHPADEIGLAGSQPGARHVMAGGPVVDHDIVGGQGGTELVHQAHLAVVIIPLGIGEHAGAARAPHHDHVQQGKTAAALLRGRLGIGVLVFRRVGQGERGAVQDLDHAALQERTGGHAVVGGLGAGVQGRFEQGQGQPCARLAIGAVALGHDRAALQAEHGLKLAHDVAAGGVALEHLPQEAPPGAPHRVGPLARADLGEGLEASQEVAEAQLELVERAAAQAVEGGEAGRAAAKATAPGGEAGRVRHRAVYLPLS